MKKKKLTSEKTDQDYNQKITFLIHKRDGNTTLKTDIVTNNGPDQGRK